MNSSQQQFDLFDMNKNIGVVVISTLDKSLGKIKLANQEISNMTGLNIQQLVHTNIASILPNEIDD